MAETMNAQAEAMESKVYESSLATDQESDSFEDAVDTGSLRSMSARSLTSRSSGIKMSRPNSNLAQQKLHAISPDDVEDALPSPIESTDEESIIDVDEKMEENPDETITEMAPGAATGTATETATTPTKNDVVEEVDLDLDLDLDHAVKSIEPEAEPLTDRSEATSKRSSNVSEGNAMDNVNLDDASTKETSPAPAPPPKQPPKKLSLGNLASMFSSSSGAESPEKRSPNPSTTGAVPPSVAPGSTAEKATAAAAANNGSAPAQPGRKFGGAFSWLSRNSNSKDNITPPPIATVTSPRRNTASSVTTITSNPEMMLSKLEEGDENEGRPARNSLKDRFKLVRMREEAGVNGCLTPDGIDEKSLGASKSASTLGPGGVTSPILGDGTDGQVPLSPIPPSPNPSLAPGTVSGISAGPSALADQQVDWDLWQSVVYEGPSAVSRTSAEELNRAIASGIPNVIRGVVWQVLAQSKSDDLESVYRDLVARGTEKDKSRNRISNSSTSASTSSNGASTLDKEAVTSSASSVQSEVSGAKSPPSEKDSEALAKAHVAAAASRQRKEKEDAAMLQKLEKAIRRDTGARTSYSKHLMAAGLQEGLFGVCKAYALFDESVGYAQGMNFLVMPILFNMPEDEAFCLLVRMMNQYKLRDMFTQDMPGLHMHLYQFERLLEDLEPALYCHLHRKGISGHLYATQWFLTLFAYRFPLQLVLRIYDLILSEGLSAILKFGIVLLQKNAQTLLGMTDMAQLTTFLKDKVFDVYIDQAPSAGSILENGFFGSSSSNVDKEIYRADQLIRDACEVKLTPELLKTYTREWEDKTRAEKEREMELEHLKQANTSHTIKIRKLEDRIEACDTEQASMANELVHTKIENEELKDENESLKGQVTELRNVIEKQPQEIEDKWQAERDSLMERNQKVHEENERVEKEMAELEEELVQTKMRYAEINAAHEALQRKWSEMKKQFA